MRAFVVEIEIETNFIFKLNKKNDKEAIKGNVTKFNFVVFGLTIIRNDHGNKLILMIS